MGNAKASPDLSSLTQPQIMLLEFSKTYWNETKLN